MKPLCFVLMPSGTKPDPTGGNDIDFDRLYEKAIRPAIEDAGMEPVCADEERAGGIVSKTLYERLLLCDFAVADLTTASARVFYELGVRHTARPSSTITLVAEGQPIPFDMGFLQSLPYDLGEANVLPDESAVSLRQSLTAKLAELQDHADADAVIDSPLYQLLGDWQSPDIARLKTDVFRERLRYNETVKAQLSEIRAQGRSGATRDQAAQRLATVRSKIGALDAVDAGTLVDLMLTYRALSDWTGMIELHANMPKVLAEQILVQEQLGFALNRTASGNPAARAEALAVLTAVEERQGANSETCGLLGRIHKDYWKEAVDAGEESDANRHLANAIDAYVRGFMADLRDPYPGVNAVTLLEIKGDESALQKKRRLAPVVLFAAERRLDTATADYWDYATMLELLVINNDPDEAGEYLQRALAVVRESWEPQTTENNLQLIALARERRGETVDWLRGIIDTLRRKRVEMS